MASPLALILSVWCQLSNSCIILKNKSCIQNFRIVQMEYIWWFMKLYHNYAVFMMYRYVMFTYYNRYPANSLKHFPFTELHHIHFRTYLFHSYHLWIHPHMYKCRNPYHWYTSLHWYMGLVNSWQSLQTEKS